MNKIRTKKRICPDCKTLISDLNRHYSKDANNLTRCEKHIKKMIPKRSK